MTDPLSPPPPPSPAAITRVFTATLVMGPPGSGKTSLAETVAEYLWETYRKVLLLYSTDGGAIPTGVQKRMKQNLIRFWRMRTRSAEGLGIESLYLGSKGYWPKTINPISGETAPAVELVAPLSTRYAVSCPGGHLLHTLPALQLVQPTFCSTCKQMVGRDQLHVEETVQRARGFEHVGGVFFDGLTSMANVVVEHMDHARGAGQIGGEKSAFGGVVVSGSVRMGGNNRADIGFGQTRAQQFVNNSLGIPGLVEGPIFTSLTMESTDEGGLSIVGLKLPGRAATDEGSAWFGNVLEMGRHYDDMGKDHFALYLRPFTDKQGRRHLLKTSASSTGLPDVLIDPLPSEGTPFSIANLGNVFRMLDEDLRISLQEVVPGVPEAPSEYGDPLQVVDVAGAVARFARETQNVVGGGTPLTLPLTLPLIPSVSTPGTSVHSATPTVMPSKGGRRSTPTAVPPPTLTADTGVPLPVPVFVSPPAALGVPPPPPGMKPPMKLPGV